MFTTSPEKSRILVLAPHTDDGEIGCGGTIVKLLGDGHAVHYIAFSDCADSLPPGYAPDTLRVELASATATLGIPRDNVTILEYPVRRMLEHRQSILDFLVKLRSKIDPNVIFCPSTSDLHQDHSVVANEAIRAFKDRTVLLYEMPWNNIIFETRCFIELTEEQLERKIEALRAYKSQRSRSYLNGDMIRSLAIVRGTSVKVRYAEAFDVARICVI